MARELTKIKSMVTRNRSSFLRAYSPEKLAEAFENSTNSITDNPNSPSYQKLDNTITLKSNIRQATATLDALSQEILSTKQCLKEFHIKQIENDILVLTQKLATAKSRIIKNHEDYQIYGSLLGNEKSALEHRQFFLTHKNVD